MSLRKWLDVRLTHAALFGFRLRQLTAVFGVKNAAALEEVLTVDDREQGYANVYGLHNLRWVSFDAAESGGVAAIEGCAHLLVLSLVCDGNIEDVLAELLRVARPRFCEILSHCVGFGEATNVLEFIDDHRVPCGYFFRDLGPLLNGAEDLLPTADATRAEIEDAFAAQDRFERFYADFGHADAGALRAAYLSAFRDEALPVPLAAWERARSDEASATRRVVDAMRKMQDNAARSSNSGKIRRSVHAKSHGLLTAELEVVPSPVNVGLFAERRTFKAELRPSNGFAEVRKDGERDARGLALRVLIPTNEPIAGKLPEFIIPPQDGQPGYQDFVLVNYPVFFSPDIQSFSLLLQGTQLSGWRDKLLSIGAASLRSGGARQLLNFARTLTSKIRHPLDAVFHSQSPYQLGPDYVAKYSVEPKDPHRFGKLSKMVEDDGLSAALKASLLDDPVRLRLFVHVLPTNEAPRGYDSLADVIEDATLDWDDLGAQKHHVANIIVGAKQDPTSGKSVGAAERIRFNPWNALVAHRPLGSLNRARWVAYRASQQQRSGILPPALDVEQRVAAE